MKKIPKFNRNIILGVILLAAITLSVIKIVQSAVLNPGHAWATLDDAPLPIANGGTSQTTATAAFDALDPITTLGDIIYGGASGVATRLGGAAGFLKSTGAAAPAWSTVNLAASADVGTSILPVANGGTGVATLGDAGVLIGNITGVVQVTGAGNSGQVLTSNGAGVDPTFQAAAGGNDPRITMDALTTGEQFDVTANSVVLTEAVNLSQTLAAGTYTFRYYVIWRTNDATNGIRLAVNYTGTNGAFVWWWCWTDAIATASTAAADQDAIIAAGQVAGCHASRAKSSTTRGATISADTANADMMATIEGVFVATGAGDLELWAGNDAAGAGDYDSLMIGTSVEIHKTK